MRSNRHGMGVGANGKLVLTAVAAVSFFFSAAPARAQHEIKPSESEPQSAGSVNASPAGPSATDAPADGLAALDTVHLAALAEAGHADAQAELASRDLNGIGVDLDYVDGLAWARASADQNNPRGEYLLGECNFNGWATAVDKDAAEQWFEKSANQGFAQGEYALGHYWIDRGINGSAADYIPYVNFLSGHHESNEIHKGEDMIRVAAEHGYVPAEFEAGTDAVASHNYDEAITWFEKAAAAGNVASEIALGNLYYTGGKKFPKQPAEAISWYQKAAEKNATLAFEKLGDASRDGVGVSKDPAQAVAFYKKAGVKYLQAGVFGGAANVFKKAADLNDPQAEVWMASLYQQGLGVKQNQKKSEEMYAKVAAQNYSGSQQDVDLLNQAISQARSREQAEEAAQSEAYAQGQAAFHQAQAREQAQAQAQQSQNNGGSDRKSWIAIAGLGAAGLVSSAGGSPTTVLQTGLAAAALTAKVTSSNPNDATTAILSGAAQGATGQVDSPILDAARQQGQQMIAVGAANDAARQQSAAARQAAALSAQQRTQLQQQQVQTASLQQAGAAGNGLPMPQAGPVTIVFTHSQDWSQGSATATSYPSGINCPAACSAYFAKGIGGAVTFQADANSIIHQVNCGFYESDGSTLPRTPGNNWTCTLPTVNGWEGATMIVYVDQAGSFSGQQAITGNGKQIPPGATNCGSLATGFVPCPGTGAGNSSTTSTSSGSQAEGQGSGQQISGGSSSSGGGLNPSANSGGCSNENAYVKATVKVGSDGFVVGWLTNTSNQTLYVTFTFGRGGKPYGPESGSVTLASGQTIGGELGGIWAPGTDVDTNPPLIYWYAVLQSDVNAGKNCGRAW